jgi:hypothetical protein
MEILYTYSSHHNVIERFSDIRNYYWTRTVVGSSVLR